MLQQTSKQETEWEFAEIWVDTLISPPYILMLVKEQSGKFCILPVFLLQVPLVSILPVV